MLNLLNIIHSYIGWQETCDTDCDTFLGFKVLGILSEKSHPRTHRNLTTSKKGLKGRLFFCHCANNLALIVPNAHSMA